MVFLVDVELEDIFEVGVVVDFFLGVGVIRHCKCVAMKSSVEAIVVMVICNR